MVRPVRTVSEALVPSQLLLPLPQHHVLICRACRYAIPPLAIDRHLKEIHHLDRARREVFLDFASKFDLSDPAHVDEPGADHFPVPELPLYDGLQCTSSNCRHLCLSEKRMRRHWQLVHGRHCRPSGDWKHAPIQTFFRGNRLRYFTGSVVEPSHDSSGHSRHKHMLRGNVIRTFYISEDGRGMDIAFGIPEGPGTTTHGQERQGTEDGRVRLDQTDRALLDHYKTSTCLTIATDEETRAVWSTAVVRLAYCHRFLMDAILALAALHLAHCHRSEPAKSREYLAVASKHQDEAMPPFRKAVSEADASKSHAVVTFVHLLILYSIAMEHQDEQLLLVPEGQSDVVVSWLHLLRTGSGMLCATWHLIEIGPCQQLSLVWREETSLSPAATLLASELRDKFLAAIPRPGSQDEWARSERDEYANAASYLALAFAYHSQPSTGPCTTWDILRIWPHRLSDPFMAMMAANHPGALILLAHYAILLKDIEQHWYFKGRATRLIRRIAERLEERWQTYIESPLRAIRTPVVRPRRLLPGPL
ncbi:hypothetical protein A1O3_05989 [Capronia epimyces CBS 606.96]|uniref:C2H2-type domain-containing protein n=1 Tax=Capronia epimyces CBS 606.96 TaxID=1182542 RepID=W9YSQ6_9EURO|nr:uncharacterized protein A1O3_05989 [Capronia epimyces CBS 606.96]EXJ85314.1 hypothetical protein A1O3_05989 [Capronia epimyces CBS 606.96]